jgi:Short C-terminal domain
MQRHHHSYRGGPFLRRPGLPPFGHSGLLGNLIVGGLGYLIGRQQVQNQSQQSQPQANTQSDQLAQLRLLGQMRESGVLTEEEFQEQKQKILQKS